MRLEANLMQNATTRVGRVRIPQRWGLPSEIVHVEADGRMGLFIRNAAKPPLIGRDFNGEVNLEAYDYRQVKLGPEGFEERDHWLGHIPRRQHA